MHTHPYEYTYANPTIISTTHTHTHPYEHIYANPTTISTSEGLSWQISRLT
jgi:hypothetical protein